MIQSRQNAIFDIEIITLQFTLLHLITINLREKYVIQRKNKRG